MSTENLTKSDICPVRLFYWNGSNNFGDELSKYIVEKISGKKFLFGQPKYDRCLVAVGSILTYDWICSDIIVWGTGTKSINSLKKPEFRLFPLSRAYRRIKNKIWRGGAIADVRAVRGPLTRKQIIEYTKCPEVYGDPAILLPLLYEPKSNKEYKAGIVIHQTTQALFTPKIQKKLLGRGILPIFLTVNNYPEIQKVIDDICSCEKIFSNSLHGIVVAQTYGIKTRRFTVKGKPIHPEEDYKFEDYFLGCGQLVQSPFEISTAQEIDPNILIGCEVVETKKIRNRDALMKSFPRL